MPPGARDALGGYCYHVLNRGNARRTVFHKEGDFAAFLKLLGQAGERVGVRLLAYCLLSNHFHLLLWPREDGALSAYMMWLATAHVRRYHQHYHSSGHVWQGRFRSFPIQEDEHLLTVHRYIERNPVRAGLVARVQDWLWCSASAPRLGQPRLVAGPVAHAADWLSWVNEAQTEAELEAVRECIRRRRPYGNEAWARRTAEAMGLESSLRPRGPPRKTRAAQRLHLESTLRPRGRPRKGSRRSQRKIDVPVPFVPWKPQALLLYACLLQHPGARGKV
jgi:putative transposase